MLLCALVLPCKISVLPDRLSAVTFSIKQQDLEWTLKSQVESRKLASTPDYKSDDDKVVEDVKVVQVGHQRPFQLQEAKTKLTSLQ